MSLINIGMSGLNAAQFALNTTGNNISNSGTAGYNRQVVNYAQQNSQFTGMGYLGQGVLVTDVSRVYDQFLSNQVNQAQTQYSQLNTYYQQISQINNALGSSTTGLSASMSNFFTNLQTIVTAPNNSATRATVISSAQTLTSMFQSLSGTLSSLRASVNGTLTQSTDQINTYAKQIASLNDAIQQAQANGINATPNDLLDQRDLAVANLNAIVQTNVVKDSSGAYNVFIGNGQSLVTGNSAYQLTTVPSASDPSQMTIAYVSPNGTKVPIPESSITGGSLAGLLSFRSGALTQAQNSLGQIALSLAGTFNAQNQLGLDLYGNLGGNFFTVPNPTVIASTTNSNGATLNATITDASKVTASDYNVSFDGTTYTLTRQSDGAKWTAGAPATPGAALNFQDSSGAAFADGFSVTTGGMVAGDSFTIQPTRNAAQNIGVSITDPGKIALAAPIIASTGSGNGGSLKVDQGSVDKSYLSNVLTAPVSFTFSKNATTGALTLVAPSPMTVTVNGVTTSYAAGDTVPYDAANGAKITMNGMTVNLSGTPNDGDKFTIAPNTSGAVTDNRNGLALSALQNDKTQVGGSQSYATAYANLVSFVGSTTNTYKATSAAQATLLQQAQTAQQSNSGVNLDEEAANLIKYQQLYQANSKVIQTASSLFDTILQMVN
ncbi:flagellar hook-associated protein FlgK [Pandoraea apista]|nr:flagellar hook-associated protein FlgK [Pandoraea apista]ALS66325.1 flagellar hook-associated protein FlgK [Pandoraea apista]OXS94882.1 flagellar hook-associated protein FlgK [Pandoraea apista]RRW96429.1 flagellar hook-associated protein FlgK [Pandoraea apista]RRX03623.1 flagellar hook-associated protein FlgK [Pandoraea apista]